MQHRNDIDGLRAVAVLAVVLFHLGFSERLAGGFVGVDVFFVISGYLITQILQADVEAGKLSLAEFYNRRVRRIFPALFVMYAGCLGYAAFTLFPTEVRRVARDVLWSLAFLSNVSFAKAAGYFDESSHSAPLLHTWSLSVEEQFYIGLPLLLWALSRARRWLRIAVITVIALASFALSQRMVSVAARDAFYLVHCRAWELLLGSLLALRAIPALRRRVLAEIVAVLGLAAILLAVFVIKSATPFPGYWALLPCGGAAAVLYAGSEVRTLTARLLGSPPLRLIGLISYSLYLWHWPLIAFFHARHDEMSGRVRFALLAASFLLAVLSYRFVEQPFRRKPQRLSSRATLFVAALAMLGVLGLALGTPAAAARLRPESVLTEQALSHLNYPADVRSGTCFLSGGFDDVSLFRKDLCLATKSDRPNYLILGDSHAAHFVPAFKALRPDINFLQATASGCQAVRHGTGARRCTELFRMIFDEFLPNTRVDVVVLAGHWPRHNLTPLLRTVKYLRPLTKRVVVLGPVVDYNQPFPLLLARSISENNPGLPAEHLIKQAWVLDQLYAAQLARTRAEYYSVYEATCPRGACTLWAAPGVPMQYDQHHLTLEGAKLVLERLGPRLFR